MIFTQGNPVVCPSVPLQQQMSSGILLIGNMAHNWHTLEVVVETEGRTIPS